MRIVAVAASPVWFSILCVVALAACLDAPMGESAAGARIIVVWEPLACGEPHRVAVELADEAGVMISASAPCTIGAVTLEAPHFGAYAGRIYAWAAGRPNRSIAEVTIYVEESVVRWEVATPE